MKIMVFMRFVLSYIRKKLYHCSFIFLEWILADEVPLLHFKKNPHNLDFQFKFDIAQKFQFKCNEKISKDTDTLELWQNTWKKFEEMFKTLCSCCTLLFGSFIPLQHQTAPLWNIPLILCNIICWWSTDSFQPHAWVFHSIKSWRSDRLPTPTNPGIFNII